MTSALQPRWGLPKPCLQQAEWAATAVQEGVQLVP